MLSFFDVILLVVLSGFVFYGAFFGIIRTIGGLFGVIIGVIAAGKYYIPAYEYLDQYFFGFDSTGKILCFLFLFFLVRKLVVFAFYLLDKSFHLISLIPFLTSINRLAGAIFGFIEGSLIIGVLIFIASRYTILESLIGQWLYNSQIAPLFLKVSSMLWPLLPDFLKTLQALI